MAWRGVLAAGILLASVSAGQAGEAADAMRERLYAGQFEALRQDLDPLLEQEDREALFALGFSQVLAGFETLLQDFYRYGIALPTGFEGPEALTGAEPANPNPETLSYEGLRETLERFAERLDAGRENLLASADGDFVVDLDLLRLRLDIDGDGTLEPGEGVASFVFSLDPQLSELIDLGDAKAVGKRAAGMPGYFGFDRADAIWMAGYAHVLAGHVDLLLAHDFSDLFSTAFHRLFPQSGLPMQDFAKGATLFMGPENDAAIADAIAAIHSLDFPVVEPRRLARVLTRAKLVLEYSRRNWEAILAETDDHGEFLPSPSQTPPTPEARITQEMVDAWLATLDTVEQVLDGELLLPHWRFEQGFDLKAYFETATRTDLVLLLSGYGALPYLKDGPKVSAETFAAANEIFGGRLLGYAFWFN